MKKLANEVKLNDELVRGCKKSYVFHKREHDRNNAYLEFMVRDTRNGIVSDLLLHKMDFVEVA